MNQYIFDKLQVLDLHKIDLLAALQRWGQSMIALLVAAVLAVWLIGPKTGAGLFDLAHYLVPAEARALILGTDSAEILTADESAGQLKLWNSAGRDIPSIASQAALIPSHFELVSNESASGITRISLDAGVPIANGILTCDTDEQATARTGEKGRDCARAAVEMANLALALTPDIEIESE